MLHAYTREKKGQLMPSNTPFEAAPQVAADLNVEAKESKLSNLQDGVIQKISDAIELYSCYLEEKTTVTQTNSAVHIFRQALTDKIELFATMLKELQDAKAQGIQPTAEILSVYEHDLAQAEAALGTNLQRAAKAQIKEFITDTALWSTQVNQLVGGKSVETSAGETVRVPDGIEQMMRAMLPQFTANNKDKHFFFKTSIVNVGAVVRTSVGSAQACLNYMNECSEIAVERLNRKKCDTSSAVTKLYQTLKIEGCLLRDPHSLCHFIKMIKAQHDALKEAVILAASNKNSPRRR